ncbi:hypothetical protein LR48_Vigan01g093100 [Vigna angularis]|uniref:Uncharacterized protein n=1 Tax=Phaseolus angularis TaxID=3914 RepID=A0A0L9TLL6_PHAAN|nr:hypothetical protein LR48_Vigan01g093100 [Vigna angularis]
MKGDWYPDVVRVFYHNLNIVNVDIHSRVKGINIHIDNFIWMLLTRLEAEGASSYLPNSEINQSLRKRDLYKSWLRFPERYPIERLFVHERLRIKEKIIAYLLAWVILPGRLIRDRMSTEDVYLLHAIKSNIPTNWVEVIKNHMMNVVFKKSHYLPYAVFISKVLEIQGVNVNGEQRCSCSGINVINRNTIASLGLVKTVKGWCFKSEENLSYSSGSNLATKAECTYFTPETNFERFAAEQFRILNEKFNNFERRFNEAQQRKEDNNSDEDTMKTSDSE